MVLAIHHNVVLIRLQNMYPQSNNAFSPPLLTPSVCQVVNQHLMKDLTELGLWDEAMKHQLIAHGGSIQVRYVPGVAHLSMSMKLSDVPFLLCRE